jgi:hypothetical protein
MHLLPSAPGRVLDIGAGAGSDAAWFVARGQAVMAVAPVAAFRCAVMDLHRAPGIEWVDDNLPLLTRVCQRGHCFDIVIADGTMGAPGRGEREAGMAVLACSRNRLQKG